MQKNNIIEFCPYLQEMKKEELIEMTIKYCVEDWDADEHDQKYLRAFFRAELSDNPNFWHSINKAYWKKAFKHLHNK